jgi:hypothetical protein
MEETSINALVDAKTEYTKQLTSILSPLIYEGFQSIYNEATEIKNSTEDPRYDDFSNLKIFQDFLRKIPKWNQDMIDAETERIIEKTNCKWLEKLIGAVFISNAKVLSTIRTQNFGQKMKLEIPTTSRFIHKCYIESGREFYRNVYLFDDEDVSPFEKQKNIRECLTIVKEAIQEAIRRLLPVQEIIKTYLGNVYQNSDDDVSVISEQFMNETLDKYADHTLKDNILSQEEELVNEISSPEEVPTSPKPDNTEQITLLEEFVSKNESSDRVKTPQDEVVEKLLKSEETTISDEILKQLSDHEQSDTNEDEGNFEDAQEQEFGQEEINTFDQVEEPKREEEQNIETESFGETEVKEETIVMEDNESLKLEEEESSIVTENIDENVEKVLEEKYKSQEKQIVIRDKKKNALKEKLLRRQAMQKRRKEEEIMRRNLERKRAEEASRRAEEERQRMKTKEEPEEDYEDGEQDKHDYVFFGDEKSDEEDYEEEEEVVNYS